MFCGAVEGPLQGQSMLSLRTLRQTHKPLECRAWNPGVSTMEALPISTPPCPTNVYLRFPTRRETESETQGFSQLFLPFSVKSLSRGGCQQDPHVRLKAFPNPPFHSRLILPPTSPSSPAHPPRAPSTGGRSASPPMKQQETLASRFFRIDDTSGGRSASPPMKQQETRASRVSRIDDTSGGRPASPPATRSREASPHLIQQG